MLAGHETTAVAPAWTWWLLARHPQAQVHVHAEVDALLVASQYAVQRDPHWWREPDAFRPERWSNGESATAPKFAYFPFGGGTRVCIGEAFAWTELVPVIAAIARRFRFVDTGDGEPGIAPSVTLRPGRPIALAAIAR